MRRIIILNFLILTSILAFSQGEENSLKGVPANERIVTGGGFGLGFGNVQDYVSVSPILGYALTKKLIVGTGVSYRYTKYKLVSPSVSFNDYSINPFVRFTIYNGIFIQAEYEHMNFEYLINSQGETNRNSFNSFMAGGGFVQPLGSKASLFLMALYNFSYTASTSVYTPYQSPWVVRAGVNIGGVFF